MSKQKILDILELIREDRLTNEIHTIKQMEDMITDLHKSDKKSSLTEDPLMFIWNLTDNKDIIDINDVSFDEFNEAFNVDINKLKNVVIKGAFIRQIFDMNDIPIKKELTLIPYGDDEDNNITEIFDLTLFNETNDTFTKTKNIL